MMDLLRKRREEERPTEDTHINIHTHGEAETSGAVLREQSTIGCSWHDGRVP